MYSKTTNDIEIKINASSHELQTKGESGKVINPFQLFIFIFIGFAFN